MINIPPVTAEMVKQTFEQIDKRGESTMTNTQPSLQETTQLIREWAIERNLHTADPTKQMLKLIEEVGEIAAGLARGNRHEVKDGIGDVKVVTTILKEQLKNGASKNLSKQNLVSLLFLYDLGLLAREVAFSQDADHINSYVEKVEYGLVALSEILDTNIEECVNLAYNEIKDRKGKMVDGVFVKEDDLK